MQTYSGKATAAGLGGKNAGLETPAAPLPLLHLLTLKVVRHIPQQFSVFSRTFESAIAYMNAYLEARPML